MCEYEKKNWMILGIVIFLIILLIPRIETLKDGGTKIYKSLTYTITKYHERNENNTTEYSTGLKIQLFGITIYEKRDSEKIKSETEKELEKEALDVTSSFVNDLYSKITPSEDANVLKGLYEKEGTLSNQYILSVGIVNLVREKQLNNEEYLNPKEIEEQIHKILGTDNSFQHETTMIFSSGICGYEYSNFFEQYKVIDGCGGNWYEFFKRKLISAEKQGNFIYLKEKMIYFTDDWDDYLSRITIYNNYQKEKKLEYIETSSQESYSVSIDDYIDQASTYLYTFEKQGNNYILKGIKEVDE